LAVLLTSSTASRFGASAVRNIELVTQVAAIATHMMYEPMRRADGRWACCRRARAGAITETRYRRSGAVFDGVNGARIVSAITTA